MTELFAGTGKSNITPRNGVEMIGYFNRPDVSQGVHDDLYARAIVLKDGSTQVALCSVELLWLRKSDVDAIRQLVIARCGLSAEQIFIFATHTHGGPAIHKPENWDRSYYERVADAIVQAYETMQPAQLGCGFGQLFGYSINRRWLNRPVDPAVGVIRIDRADGSPLAVFSNFACHAVVMGYDNLLITADWPGYSSRLLEAELGDGVVALFAQGGAGNVNPLTETVRQRLAAGHPVTSIGFVSNYYGYQKDAPDAWNIEDRGGGRFIECETIARAYNAEVMRVWRSVTTKTTVPLWLDQVTVDAAVGPDEAPAAGMTPSSTSIINAETGSVIPLDIRLVGIGSAVLVGQPGEVFSETSIAFRVKAQNLKYGHPMLVSYANGTYAYLPPEDAFPEGGYEVNWPRGLGISQYTQNRIADAIDGLLKAHATS
ncbi:MAG: neutral/alkaline non-lysosomal ceramidase N-terminal domain-containing protein [Anaerolineae bacterium]|nr:neutral/alkaline non-lysosomal ceramidase N-terminal domain-containing protein [Anaerolineae bacterium]